MPRLALSLFCLVLGLPAARAQVPACDKLEGGARKLADQILSSQHPYDCCDKTLAECLKQKPVCSLVVRLAGNICRRVEAHQTQEQIIRGLSRRARSMTPMGKPARINLDQVPVLGDPQAPVALVMYACPRCPLCSKMTPALHRAVSQGVLQGKARLYFKTYPIRGHEYSAESGMGFLAAARLGHFWEFVLLAFENFEQFSPERQGEWAQAVGIKRDEFDRLQSDSALRERLIAVKKEGIINRVDATPTFFINGRKWFGDLTPEEILDVVEEEFQRVKGIEQQE